MPDFDITIKTPTELTGAVQCADALEKDIGKAKALGQEFGALEAKLAAVKASIKQYNDTHVDAVAEAKAGEEAYLKEMEALGQNADGSKKAAEATDKLEMSHRQLHGVLEQVAPGLAGIARFLTSGFAMAVGGAIMLFQTLNAKLGEFNEFLNSIGNSANARGEWVEKMRQEMEQSDVAFAAYEHNIQRIIDAQRTIAQLADTALARDREKLASDSAIAAAQKALADARVDMMLKLGQITQEQSIKLKLDIDEAYFKQQLEAKIAGIQAEINERTKQQGATRNAALDADEKVQSTKAAADAAAQAKIKNDEKLAQDKKNLEESIATQQKAQATVDALQGKGAWGGNWDKSDPQYYELKAAKEQVESEARRQGGLKSSIKGEQDRQYGLDTAATTTKADYEAAKAQQEELINQFKELNAKLADLNATKAGATAENATLENLHNQTAETHAAAETPGAEGGDIENWTKKTNDNIAVASQANPNAALAMISGAFQDINQFLSTHPALNQANWDKLQKEWGELRKDQAIILQRLANRRD